MKSFRGWTSVQSLNRDLFEGLVIVLLSNSLPVGNTMVIVKNTPKKVSSPRLV